MPYLDIEALAAVRQIKPATVRWHRKRGNLPPADHYFGRSPVWSADTVATWLTERYGITAAQAAADIERVFDKPVTRSG